MNERRTEKFVLAAKRSQLSMTLILENISDPLNIGAILRTCDSVGIREIYVVNTSEEKDTKILTVGKRSSMGTRKWVDVHYFKNLSACIEKVRLQYDLIVGAALTERAISYLSMDYTGSIAIMMGNEKDGLSPEALQHCHHTILIPQVGLAESLNVSVATAVILYEAFRQRQLIGKYDTHPDVDESTAQAIYDQFIVKIRDATKNSKRFKIKPIG